VGQLEEARLSAFGAAECAFFITKEFTFYKVLWKSAAVDVNPRQIAAQGMMVDCTRDQLFSGSGLANDQHGRIVACDPFDHLKQASHGFAAENSLDSRQLQNHGFGIGCDDTPLLRAECRSAE
jgi:hypothetical protein